MSSDANPDDAPFATAGVVRDLSFWKTYLASRPSPSEDLFRLITTYHASHGDPRTEVVHDVGTGPGNIAARLSEYFDHVVGSDINKEMLTIAPALVPADRLSRMTFIQSKAEDLLSTARRLLPAYLGEGQTDMVVAGECIPLVEASESLRAFHGLLRPGGSLAIYFYGRPIFVADDGSDAAACDVAYEKLATRMCQLVYPQSGSVAEGMYKRGYEALTSHLDSIAIPPEAWSSVERHKWNSDRPLMFNGPEVAKFEIQPVDRRTDSETEVDVKDRGFWAHDWDVDDVQAYLDTIYPGWRDWAGADQTEIDELHEELKAAMGGGKRRVTFSVVLILATKK